MTGIKLDESFDFGFSLIDETEIETEEKRQKNKDTIKAKDDEIAELEKTVGDIIAMVIPLLNNLAAKPEKTTIYWPNRQEKIAEFKNKLLDRAGLEEKHDI